MPTGSATRRASGRFVVILFGLGTACLALWSLLMVTRALTWELVPNVHVRWRSDLPEPERRALENRFLLVNAEHTHPTTWAYDLLDISTSNIRALVKHRDVADTAEIDPYRFEISGTAPVGRHEAWLIHRFPIARHPWVLNHLFTTLLGGAFVCLSSAYWLKHRRVKGSTLREPSSGMANVP